MSATRSLTSSGRLLPWSAAWREAHLGPKGFYREQSPREHFATEAQGGPLVDAVATIIGCVDARLDRPAVIDVVDVGAGSGELLRSLSRRITDQDLARRCRFTGIDVRPRPGDLPHPIEWVVGEAPAVFHETWPEGVTGVILAHEWLDDLPVDVVERDARGTLREVLVDPLSGTETLGDAVDPESDTQRWLDAWWGKIDDRAEVGIHRDRAWSDLCSALHRGTALAIDYGHTADERHRFAAGSIVGYRDGTTHWPIPDGSMNLTAHVAWESLIAATNPPGLLQPQAQVLAEFLPRLPHPDRNLAEADPSRFAALLEAHSAGARLRERSAGVSWLRVDAPDG